MSKNLIIIVVIIGLIFLGLIWLVKRETAIEKPLIEEPATEESLSEKEFYTREDLKYIRPEPGTASIYYMWMAGCPVCATLDKWFEETEEIYSIKVYKFDISRESALFRDMLEAYSVPAEKRGFVPALFIGDRYVIGFDPESIEYLVKECLQNLDCINPYDKLK